VVVECEAAGSAASFSVEQGFGDSSLAVSPAPRFLPARLLEARQHADTSPTLWLIVRLHPVTAAQTAGGAATEIRNKCRADFGFAPVTPKY
jgi:hypothetical protein